LYGKFALITVQCIERMEETMRDAQCRRRRLAFNEGFEGWSPAVGCSEERVTKPLIERRRESRGHTTHFELFEGALELALREGMVDGSKHPSCLLPGEEARSSERIFSDIALQGLKACAWLIGDDESTQSGFDDDLESALR